MNMDYFRSTPTFWSSPSLITLMILRLLTLIKQDIQDQQQIISLYSECLLIETDCLSHNIY